MPRRLVLLACAGLVVVAAAVVLIARGGKDDGPDRAVGDQLGQALSYIPASAPLVGALETDGDTEQVRALGKLVAEVPALRFAAGQLQALTREVGLDYDDDVVPLLGAPLVFSAPRVPSVDLAALLRDGALAVLVAPSPGHLRDAVDRAVRRGGLRELPRGPGGARLYRARAGVLGIDGPTLLVAADEAAVRRALDVKARRAGLTRTVFIARLGRHAGPALLRMAALPRVLLGDRLARVSLAQAARNAALSLRLEDPGVRLRFEIATDPARVRDEDLPVAPGAAPPSPAGGAASSVVAVRDFSHTLRWLDSNRDTVDLPLLQPLEDILATADDVRGPLKTFGGIDIDEALLDQLTGTTTITREARGGFGLRAELRDGGPLRTALGRIASVPDIALDLAGASEYDLDRSGDDAYTFRQGSRLVRLAVLGNLLVATDDPSTGLRELANRRPAPAAGAGAFAARLSGDAVHDFLISQLGLPSAARLFLGGIGELRASVGAERTGLQGEITLAID